MINFDLFSLSKKNCSILKLYNFLKFIINYFSSNLNFYVKNMKNEIVIFNLFLK